MVTGTNLSTTSPNLHRTDRTLNAEKEKMIWYNPPYSKYVKTNLVQRFLGLVKKHFTPGSAPYSVLNKNTMKLSYICMKNMRSIIQSHNQ